MSEICVFSGSPLDRASVLRGDRTWLEARLVAAESRFLPVWKLRPLVKETEPPALAWATGAVRELVSGESATPVLLGLDGDVAHFAVDISALEKPEAALGVDGVATFQDARAASNRLPMDDAAIVAQVRAVLGWHETHPRCSGCGEPTIREQAGWMRRCPDCGREHFPRTDPVVIAVATRGDRCLLGRQASWPGGMYSALAGFVEPGESIEDAVRREIREETRVAVGEVAYLKSQPWPFPMSLMIGCMAEALSEEIHLDDHELQEARWFSRAEIRAALDTPFGKGSIFVPGRGAIANHLIRAFAEAEA